eukprot:5162626-Pleurochrysis_carterae.AAC.2
MRLGLVSKPPLTLGLQLSMCEHVLWRFCVRCFKLFGVFLVGKEGWGVGPGGFRQEEGVQFQCTVGCPIEVHFGTKIGGDVRFCKERVLIETKGWASLRWRLQDDVCFVAPCFVRLGCSAVDSTSRERERARAFNRRTGAERGRICLRGDTPTLTHTSARG